jgi:hypothetical protein
VAVAWVATTTAGDCGAAPGAAAGGAGGGANCVPAGMILSVSRRMSFTFCTTDSQRRFSARTSICAVPPVVEVAAPPVGVVPAAPNCVDAVDCILTFRLALR